jgi:hypothetical protein
VGPISDGVDNSIAISAEPFVASISSRNLPMDHVTNGRIGGEPIPKHRSTGSSRRRISVQGIIRNNVITIFVCTVIFP